MSIMEGGGWVAAVGSSDLRRECARWKWWLSLWEVCRGVAMVWPPWASVRPRRAPVAAAFRSAHLRCGIRRWPIGRARRAHRDRCAAECFYVPRSRVKGPRIDNWRCRLIAAEYDHQIADHRGLAFLVQLDDVALTQLAQGHFHHADGALDNAGTGRDDRIGLLSAQHRLGNFGGISKMTDPYLDDFHTG